MLKLHGFSASNYYNVAKLALLEKGLEFEEVLVYTGAGEDYRPDYLDKSPLGKVPCLETDEGFLTESRCIVDYLERVHPQPALYPQGAFARAKLLELTQIIDLYLELPARRLLPNFFTRTPPADAVAAEVRDVISKGCGALAKLARFERFLLGDRFTAADVSGVLHFPIVRMITTQVLGCDPLAGVEGLEGYLARLEERPTVQKVRSDQEAAFPGFVAHLREHYGLAGG
jgi:glutathione S-transferase